VRKYRAPAPPKEGGGAGVRYIRVVGQLAGRPARPGQPERPGSRAEPAMQGRPGLPAKSYPADSKRPVRIGACRVGVPMVLFCICRTGRQSHCGIGP
jgi:hypothetical protein